MMEKLSIIVPCFNEESVLQAFYKETEKWVADIQAEIEYIFIDDGSTDRTLTILRELGEQPNVHYISFSRNFGKEAAMLAGFSYAKGDAIILIDADLQHPPSSFQKCGGPIRKATIRSLPSAIEKVKNLLEEN